MSLSRKFSALTVCASLLIAGVPAHAQTYFAGNNSVSASGLTFSIASCTYTASGVTSTCSGLPDTLLVEGSGRGGATIEVIGTGSSAALTGKTTSGLIQLAFTLNVTKTNPNSNVTVTNFSNAIAGTPSLSSVSSNMVYNSYTANTTLAAPSASSGSFTSPILTSANPMSVNMTLGLATGSSTTLALSNDVLHFSPAPEPGSIALLGTGLSGLIAIRRRLRKSTQSAS